MFGGFGLYDMKIRGTLMDVYKKAFNKIGRECDKIKLNKKKKRCIKEEDAIRWGILGLGNFADIFADYLECSEYAIILQESIIFRADIKSSLMRG